MQYSLLTANKFNSSQNEFDYIFHLKFAFLTKYNKHKTALFKAFFLTLKSGIDEHR